MSPCLMLAEILEAAAARARELDSEQRAERREWTDQTQSPLGCKRHCAAVRRLVGKSSPSAAVIGRRHLLSADALAEEMQRLTTRAKKAKPLSVTEELRRDLRLIGARV